MATNKVFASYQEIIDLHTEPDKVSCIGIHTPRGSTPHKMFSGFFDQFKKFKYRGCSVTLVPAARLPVDPLQVGYDDPNDAIDPRDIMNPLMFHGCHGEDLGAILNNLYSLGLVSANYLVDQFNTPSTDLMEFANQSGGDYDISASILEKLYYKALTDNTWKKAHPQKGFKKSGLRPLIYKVNATHQIMPDSDFNSAFDNLDDVGTPALGFDVSAPNIVLSRTPTKGGLQFVANKLTDLGWIDTRNALTNQSDSENVQIAGTGNTNLDEGLVNLLDNVSKRAQLPTVYMGVILLPPAYQVVQHFRMIINHYFAFAGFRGISFQNDTLGEVAPTYFRQDAADNPPVDPPEPGPSPEPETLAPGFYLELPGYSNSSHDWGVLLDSSSSVGYNKLYVVDENGEVSFYTGHCTINDIVRPFWWYKKDDGSIGFAFGHNNNSYCCYKDYYSASNWWVCRQNTGSGFPGGEVTLPDTGSPSSPVFAPTDSTFRNIVKTGIEVTWPEI